MPTHLKPLYAYFVTSFVTPAGETRDLKDPHALASARQLWRLNQAGLLALVQERPSISIGHAAGAIAYLERARARREAELDRELARLQRELAENERDMRAHDAALAFIETQSWQETARLTGYPDGSAARMAVELRTDFLDEAGARLATNRQHRIGRLAGVSEAQGRRVDKGTPP